jgi:hypothetical protein
VTAPLTAVGLNPDMDFGLFYVKSYPASLQNDGGSTQVPVLACMVDLYPTKLERRYMTYTVPV